MSPENAAQLARWNERHANADNHGEIAAVLTENAHLLPSRGSALDLACGRGASAVWIAQQGLDVTAWDLSPVGIARLAELANRRGVAVRSEARDVIARPPEPDSFDLILVSYFLERALAPAIMAALRPGGLLFYQTFSRNAVSDCGPTNPDWRLADNELLQLFAPLLVRSYREEGRVGDCNRGTRDIAMLVAEKVD